MNLGLYGTFETSSALITEKRKIFITKIKNSLENVKNVEATLLSKELKACDVIICDMHAEATSEKKALGYFLDGQVSLVFGTHTHVQTADETILPKGTAFITDLGMCGPVASVLGMDSQVSIDRFVTGMKHSYEVASGPVELCGVVVCYDPHAKRAISIKRVREIVQLTT